MDWAFTPSVIDTIRRGVEEDELGVDEIERREVDKPSPWFPPEHVDPWKLFVWLNLPNPLARVDRLRSTLSRIPSLSPRRGYINEDLLREIKTRGPQDLITPVGFSPPLCVAEALALVEGERRITEILSWLRRARENHGYAWRALADWRHLDSICKHPDFQAFLQTENTLVDEIEEKIDHGIFPL